MSMETQQVRGGQGVAKDGKKYFVPLKAEAPLPVEHWLVICGDVLRFLHMYVYVYMYVYIYVYIYMICITIMFYVYIYMYTYVYIQVCMHIYIYIRTYQYVHMYIYIYTHLNMYTIICVYIHLSSGTSQLYKGNLTINAYVQQLCFFLPKMNV